MKVTEGLPCPVCQNTLRHYDDCPMLHRTEHLEPEPGAMLMFKGGTGSIMKAAEGLRYQLEGIRWPDDARIRMYDMTLVSDPRSHLSVCQEIMDRCGRLLVRGPGEEQAG